MSQPNLQTPRSEAWPLFIPQVVAAATNLASGTNYLVLRPPVPLRIYAAHVNVRSPIDGTATTPGKFEFRKSTAVNNVTATTDVRQQETATAAGTITSPVLQIETATVLGTIGAGGAGNATVIVTAAGMTGSPKTISVAVANNDTASQVAGKIRTALGLDADVTALFTVGGASATVSLTRITAAANDATLNISVDNGTCSGLTAAPTSANTTAGVATGTGNATVVVTAAGLSGSPLTVSVAVTAGDTAATWAALVRTALAANDAVAAKFLVSGSTTAIILTAIERGANDSTLNISLDNGTCTGITTAATSANTTAGIAPGTNDFPGARMAIQPGNYGSNEEDQGPDGFVVEANEALWIRCVDIGNNGTPAGLDVSLTVGFA